MKFFHKVEEYNLFLSYRMLQTLEKKSDKKTVINKWENILRIKSLNFRNKYINKNKG